MSMNVVRFKRTKVLEQRRVEGVDTAPECRQGQHQQRAVSTAGVDYNSAFNQ